MNHLTKQSGNVLVVKVGTETLKENGRVMVNIARQIDDLREQGKRVILVSSGAVRLGRTLMPAHIAKQVADKKQALSALGQTKLMSKWDAYFEPYKIHCAQLLVQDRNFENSEERNSLRGWLQDLYEIEDVWGEGILPVLNGNDPLTYGPIKTDNDRIAAETGDLAGAIDLVYLTDVDGIFTGHPALPDSTLIREVTISRDNIQSCLSDEHSENSTGGMSSKVTYACEFIGKNAQRNVYIGNGGVSDRKNPDTIQRLLNKEIGTWLHY